MNHYSAALLITLTLMLAGTSVRAQQAPPKPPVYSLHAMPVADTRPQQYAWHLEGGDNPPDYAFLTLDSPPLKKWVGSLPKGAEIDYRSPWAGLPMLGGLFKNYNPENDLRKPVASFERFCESRGILFCDRFPIL